MKHNNVRQVLFPILAALIWGTAFVAQDLCADVIDTFSFNAARSYIAVVVLLVIIFIFDKLTLETPTFSDNSFKLILRSAMTLSNLKIILPIYFLLACNDYRQALQL